MSSTHRFLLAASMASALAIVGCANDSDHMSKRSDRGTSGSYDNAADAGTRNQGGSVGVGPSSSNDNVPNNSGRVPAHDTTDTGAGTSGRIDGRAGTGVGNGNADAASGVDTAKPGIAGGAGPDKPDASAPAAAPEEKSGTGVGSENADTATGVDNVRPGNSGTEAPTKNTPAPSAEKSSAPAGVAGGDSDTAASTDSGSGDTKKK